ncbi:MAG: hypothetical protein GY783_19915 [Gammaproteobacteria bacterium]|nr:hypothetical protein [Gammaproteobacteria bacterium]
MLRPAIRHTAVWVLLAGLILRAATPTGYMPAAPGSGLLFELCPGQLPAGVSIPGTNSHDHHHHGAEDNSQPEPDQCQMGHLLSSAVAVDDGLAEESPRFEVADITIPPSVVKPSTSLSAYRSRGPPA